MSSFYYLSSGECVTSLLFCLHVENDFLYSLKGKAQLQFSSYMIAWLMSLLKNICKLIFFFYNLHLFS